MIRADGDLTTSGRESEPFPLLIAVAASPEQRVRLAELIDDVAPLLLVSSLDELRKLLVPGRQPPPADPPGAEADPDSSEVLTIDKVRSVARWRDREVQLTEL